MNHEVDSNDIIEEEQVEEQAIEESPRQNGLAAQEAPNAEEEKVEQPIIMANNEGAAAIDIMGGQP